MLETPISGMTHC